MKKKDQNQQKDREEKKDRKEKKGSSYTTAGEQQEPVLKEEEGLKAIYYMAEVTL